MDSGNVYLYTTHTLGDITAKFVYDDNFITPGDSERAREHLIRLYFPSSVLWIRTFKLVIVSDKEPDETDIWQQLPTRHRKNHIHPRLESQERSDVVLTLLVSHKFENTIVPLSCLHHSEPSASSDKHVRLRLLYASAIYRLDPDPDLTGNCVEFFFSCTGRYVFSTSSERDYNHIRRLITSVSILRLQSTSQRRVIPPLPPRSILSIGTNLISGEEDIVSCARLLTSCALVCRTWLNSGVHNLLWSSFIDRKDSSLSMPMHHYTRLVNCVERYPWIGEKLLMLPFPGSSLSDSWFESECQALYKPLIDSLPNLTSLHLQTSQWDHERIYLPSLQYVEYLQLCGDRGDLAGTTLGHIDTYDMLEAINEWTCLSELWVEGWNLNSTSNPHLPTLPPAYNLVKLTIHGSYDQPSGQILSLNILQHMLSNPNPNSSSLQYLMISRILGLTNDDFKSIFYLVKSSIIGLSVDNCIINTDSKTSSDHPDSKPPSTQGELALDAVVSSMPHLKAVAIHQMSYRDRIVSSLGILRKKSGPDGLFGTFDCRFSLCPSSFPADNDTKENTVNDAIHELENALRYTGWEKVAILFEAYEFEWCEYDFKVAKEIAVERGVTLEVVMIY